jgi:hypothetical protein
MFPTVPSSIPVSSSKTSAFLYVIPTISCTLPAITIIFPVSAWNCCVNKIFSVKYFFNNTLKYLHYV